MGRSSRRGRRARATAPLRVLRRRKAAGANDDPRRWRRRHPAVCRSRRVRAHSAGRRHRASVPWAPWPGSGGESVRDADASRPATWSSPARSSVRWPGCRRPSSPRNADAPVNISNSTQPSAPSGRSACRPRGPAPVPVTCTRPFPRIAPATVPSEVTVGETLESLLPEGGDGSGRRCQAEVQHLRQPVGGQHHVRRFQVPMDDAPGVGRGECLRDTDGDRHRLFWIERSPGGPFAPGLRLRRTPSPGTAPHPARENRRPRPRSDGSAPPGHEPRARSARDVPRPPRNPVAGT